MTPATQLTKGVGTVNEWTDRTAAAIVDYRQQFNGPKHCSIAQHFEAICGVLDCVSIVDGMYAIMACQPARRDALTFHTCKETYAMNVLAICNNRPVIRCLPVMAVYNATPHLLIAGVNFLLPRNTSLHQRCVPLFKERIKQSVHTGDKVSNHLGSFQHPHCPNACCH